MPQATKRATQIHVGYRCREPFVAFHKRRQRWAVIVAHRRAGKTYAAIHDVVDHALRTTKPDARFALGAPTFSQVKDVMWQYLKQAVRRLPRVRINESELWVELHNGARIRLYALDTSFERMRGVYLDGIILDEYADINPEAWKSVIRPALADRKGWAVWIGTPKGRDAFYDVYREGLKDPEGWYTSILRASETGLVDADELASARSTMSESQYNREFECSFDEPDINQLIGGGLIKAAQARFVVPTGPRLLGVDVARFGDDRTVIAWRDGDRAERFSTWRGADLMDTVGRITVAINEYKPEAVFVDVIGIGAGVVDRLHQLHFDVIPINSGSKPMDDTRYGNLRAEMWAKMALWIKERGQLPIEDDLSADLTGVTYKFDARNRMMLESKEDMKKRGMASPDLGDALALTFSQPIAPKEVRQSRQTHSEGYEPLPNRRPAMAQGW